MDKKPEDGLSGLGLLVGQYRYIEVRIKNIIENVLSDSGNSDTSDSDEVSDGIEKRPEIGSK